MNLEFPESFRDRLRDGSPDIAASVRVGGQVGFLDELQPLSDQRQVRLLWWFLHLKGPHVVAIGNVPGIHGLVEEPLDVLAVESRVAVDVFRDGDELLDVYGALRAARDHEQERVDHGDAAQAQHQIDAPDEQARLDMSAADLRDDCH